MASITPYITKSGKRWRVQYRDPAGKIPPENVIAIAVAYGHHPVGALVDTEYLDEKWASQVDPTHALKEVTEEQLTHEVLRRMKIGQANGALNTPIDELTENNVHQLKPHDAVADDSPIQTGWPDDYDS